MGISFLLQSGSKKRKLDALHENDVVTGDEMNCSISSSVVVGHGYRLARAHVS